MRPDHSRTQLPAPDKDPTLRHPGRTRSEAERPSPPRQLLPPERRPRPNERGESSPRNATDRRVAPRGALLALGFGCLWLTAACSTPRGQLRAEPPSARLFVDGRELPQAGIHALEVPYYGALDLLALPDGARDDVDAAGRAKWTIDAPVTPWIFPADFVIECVTAGLIEVGVLEHRPASGLVATNPREADIERGVVPASAASLQIRAQTMVEAR